MKLWGGGVEWRKLNNEELYTLYFSSSIIRMIKPRRMGWVAHEKGWRRRGMPEGY
jgi:hypothetical protein